jgi:site-specific DNA-methyltransferase (adenine-specific)
MKDIPDKSIDMILCDLPYGTTASEWDKLIPSDKLWEQYNRIIKDNGSVLLFANGLFEPRAMLSNLKDYKYKWVWIKNNSTNFVHAKNRPLTKHEDILVFSKAPMGHISQLGTKRMKYNPQGLIRVDKTIKAGKGRFGTVAGIRPSHKEEFIREYTNYPNDVLLNFPEVSAGKKMHTNEKPVALLEYLIKTYTNKNDVVLDNCMGSGSTGVACINTNRNFIGIELDEKYFEIAKKRIEDKFGGTM